MTVSITRRMTQFGARMIDTVNNKMFEKFISNFTNMIEQGNGDESIAEKPREAEPVKAASLVGSFIVSELKKKFDKKTESE